MNMNDDIKSEVGSCPFSPNCVSTLVSDRDFVHHMDPISYEGPREAAVERLLAILSDMDRVEIVEQQPGMIRTTFTTKRMEYVDDVVFLFDDVEKLIHFRSASRLGFWDLGVNRRRMKTITERFLEGAEGSE